MYFNNSISALRDGIDLKRIMIYVWVGVAPALLIGLWNTGYQANNNGRDVGYGIAVGSDTYQTGQSAVQPEGQVRLAELLPSG